MPQFAAVTWRVKPGNDEKLAEVMAGYSRPDSFAIKSEQGVEVGKVLATAVFLKDDTIVRVIEYEGDLADVMRHMRGQRGVREVEEAVAPFLEQPRDLSTPEGFRDFFRTNSMRVLVQRFADDGVPA
jgi:hypothetical protein